MTKQIFLALIILTASMLSPTASGAVSLPFINEIHYDNAGADSDEAVEIAGIAGFNLLGWSIVLYNGSTGASYGTTALNGTIPDLQNGLGTLFYPISGIQNGSPDAIALVDSLGFVVQFSSYEGTFSAVDGPASGITSTDLAVFESSNTPAGYSLQLTGSGREYSDFIWANAMPNTFGKVNAGQTFSGSPVVSESATFSLLGLGLLGMALRMKRKMVCSVNNQ